MDAVLFHVESFTDPVVSDFDLGRAQFLKSFEGIRIYLNCGDHGHIADAITAKLQVLLGVGC
jgi:hypothetical protein